MARTGKGIGTQSRWISRIGIIVWLALLAPAPMPAQDRPGQTPAEAPAATVTPEAGTSSELMVTRDRHNSTQAAEEENDAAGESPWLIALKILAGVVALAVVIIVCLPILSGISVMVQQATRRLRRRP